MQPLTAPKDVKRYFVSPEESGQICLMACMLGQNREIFFPKLEEDQMLGFDAIAEALLKEHGYTPQCCNSDAEAVQKMQKRTDTNNTYAVHFFTSDTSGEKPYEEFYVEGEPLDLERFTSLGVITGKDAAPRKQISELTDRLQQLFQKSNLQKLELVNAIADYLPNFAHIETGKGLDQRM